MDSNNIHFDEESIETLRYIAAVSGSSISQIVEAFERLCIAISESLKAIESIFGDVEEIIADMPDDIPALKKQIKYCKNPMEMKMLNKRLNDAYKKNNRRKSNGKIK